MVHAMVPFPSTPATSFNILDEAGLEAGPLAPRYHNEDISREPGGVLAELSIDHSKNQGDASYRGQSRARQPVFIQTDLDAIGHKAPSRSSRRSVLGPNTFEPLASVNEEGNSLDKADRAWSIEEQPVSPNHDENTHPLASVAASRNIANSVEKQLAGQFEWLISFPAPACTTVHANGNPTQESQDIANGAVVFGCNLLRRKPKSPGSPTCTGDLQTDTFTFIATPLQDYSLPLEHQTDHQSSILEQNMALAQSLPTLCTPAKVAGTVEVVQQMLSPPLTAASDRTSSLIDACSPLGSVASSPRIEDSLAEIDKLEDELEAVDLYAQTQKGATIQSTGCKEQGLVAKTPSSTKRVTIAAQPATVRIKSSEKINPVLRRSSSLTLRNRQSQPLEDIPEQKVPGSLKRSKSTTLRPPTFTIPTVKSTKAPTIPNFELPGEAVSRRLKEQREARQAQQAEAQKAQGARQKPRLQKPLTKPNFELPGEAISRRKREQHEAKIRAAEEEERRRREFKARPIRYSIGPSTLPRDTITSRARQNKEHAVQDHTDLHEDHALPLAGRTSHTLPRGRNSLILPPNTESRAASISGTSISGQRSSLSAEDAAQQRVRGREIFTRDNSFTANRQKEKREKETAAQLARAEAAERSRALSREWAEKKRRKQLILRQATQASMESQTTE